MKETKLTGKTSEFAEENIQQLKTIFPDIFTEGKIDLKKLQQVLGEYIDTDSERYNFTWNGKGRAIRLAQTPSTGTLRPCKEESKAWDTTQNLYIEGDNLEVLKLLQRSYHGKVKMIYIDPPYNTGKHFVYPDNFADSIENYKKITGQVDSEGNPISSNTETSGRYHTDWLNMMFPRLKLARNLLTNDGVIFISINDIEIDNLKKLCIEIFGEENFVAQLVWSNKEGGGSSDSKHFRIKHEYILCFAKNIELLEISGVEISNRERYALHDEYETIRGPFYLQKLGMGSIRYSSSLDYPIETPDGTSVLPMDNNNGKKACWRWSKDKFKWGTQNGFIVIKKDRKDIWTVYTKQYLNCDNEGNSIARTQRPLGVIDLFSSTQASKLLDGMGLGSYFDYSKPVDLIKYLLNLCVTENSLVLDFFSGSATTAHAVMLSNIEENRNCKYIMVQLPEPIDGNVEPINLQYKNICDIGKARICKAADIIKAEIADRGKNLDTGFKLFKLDSSNIRKWQPDYDNLELSPEYIDNYVEGRSKLDIVYEIIVKYGLDLTCSIDEYSFDGQKVYSIGFGALMICLDDTITISVANAMVKIKDDLQPETWKVVFSENGFQNDSNKINIKKILKCGGLDDNAFTTL